MATSDEDLVAELVVTAYENEDSEFSEDLIFIEEERIDSDETRNELNEDAESVNNLLEGTTETVAEFLPLEKVKSPVWKCFGFPSRSGEYVEKDKRRRKEVFCTLCKKSLNYMGSTTNMIVHLQYRHLVELVSVQKSSVVKPPLPKGQTSIEESFGKLLLLAHSSTRWKSLTTAVCQFLARDLVPIDTVNDTGFRNMLKVFEPRYTPPD